jgi:sugar lactone lactonase YvrE
MRIKLYAFVAASLALAGCGRLDEEAILLSVEPGWAAEVATSEKDGIISADGLLWSDGTLYVADEGGSALRSWRPGAAPATLADSKAGLASPEDLVRDAAGNIYFTDDTRGGVWRTGTDGSTRALARPDQGFPSTEGLAISPAGDLIVGDAPGHRVMKVTLSGAASVLVPASAGIEKPESFAFDDRGNLYIADNHDDVLYVLTPDGRLHRAISGREGFSPESLRFAGGALLITDSHHGKLYRYTPEDGLNVIALFGGKLSNVQGIAADDRGNLYLSVQSDLKGRRGYVLRLYRRAPAA